MAVTMTDVMVVMIAFAICFMIAELAKRHVRMHCQDNPEIIWIWLDDDEEPHGGCKVKNDRNGKRITVSLHHAPSFSGI